MAHGCGHKKKTMGIFTEIVTGCQWKYQGDMYGFLRMFSGFSRIMVSSCHLTEIYRIT
jgi:hypothetical protein